jgi:hypothetical protein
MMSVCETENVMSLDTAAGTKAPASLPLQFVDIEITPIVGGRFAVAMQATLLDEERLEFVGEDLTFQQVDTLDEALAVIRENARILDAVPQ